MMLLRGEGIKMGVIQICKKPKSKPDKIKDLEAQIEQLKADLKTLQTDVKSMKQKA